MAKIFADFDSFIESRRDTDISELLQAIADLEVEYRPTSKNYSFRITSSLEGLASKNQGILVSLNDNLVGYLSQVGEDPFTDGVWIKQNPELQTLTLRDPKDIVKWEIKLP